MALSNINKTIQPTADIVSDTAFKTSPTSDQNISHRLSRLTMLIRDITFQESQMQQAEIRSYQANIQDATQAEINSLNNQGYLHAAVATVRILCLIGFVAGAALQAAEIPPAGPNTATLTLNQMPNNAAAQMLEKTLEVAKNLFQKLPHEQLPRLADAIGEGSGLLDKRFQGHITLANAKIREKELLAQAKQQDVSRSRNTEDELSNTYRSFAQGEAESRRTNG